MVNLVKKWREERGITQAELAQQVGVTSRTIISLERGKYKPSLLLAYKLAVYFDSDVETLFCLKEYLQNEKND